MRTIAATVLTAVLLTAAGVATAHAHDTGIHDNCTNFNEKYPHGVGKKHANDKGGDVTNFKRSTKIYRLANRHNSTLDGDNDGIACEKA